MSLASSVEDRPPLHYPAKREELLAYDRYKLTLPIATGGRSTVWLADDIVTGDSVALKFACVDTSEEARQSINEPAVMQHVRSTNPYHRGRRHVLIMSDHFKIKGPYGNHTCLALELHALSVPALQVQLDGRLHRAEIKRFAEQILLGLDYLHSHCGIVHSGLKMSNLMFISPDYRKMAHPSQWLQVTSIIICGFGSACWKERAAEGVVRSIAFRPPEDYIRVHVIFQFMCVDELFSPSQKETWSQDDDHLGQMINMFGEFPPEFLARGKDTNKYFNESGQLLRGPTLDPMPLAKVVKERCYMEEEDDPEMFIDFLSKMLRLVPEERSSARQLLGHPWLD
ncbi:Serine/threonine-protein kinase SRPK [Grifola frondosa]|uniref:non-specific serine/threonine protein kinase n=1 Tax=Grifola frondosa TaxID=5627 RepID=A0A1C7M5C8_GRIFR|nr:Serine/threonine-protein kinase SRPK [Grifola frondosa]